MVLEADGEARALERVFQAVHDNDADPKVLAYKYLEMLPRLGESGNGFFVIPGELSEALRTVTKAFAGEADAGSAPQRAAKAPPARPVVAPSPVPSVEQILGPSLDASVDTELDIPLDTQSDVEQVKPHGLGA
jgi:hypothetical protein